MPIFVSRFSPERSLIGSFLTSSTRGSTEGGESGRTRSPASTVERTPSAPAERTGRSTESDSARRTASAPQDAERTTSQPSSEEPSSVTLLDQLRLRRNGFNPSVPERSESNARAASAPAARSEEADAGLSIPATDLSPLARRLQALTARLSVTPQEEIRAGRGPGPGTEAAVASENQAAAASAGEGRLEAFVAALQQESQARPAAAPPAEETVPDRDEQEAALQQDLQTIASGMLSDARTETRQNLREAARNAEALSGSGSSQEVQSNRQEIRALQADRRAAQQEAQRAEQAIRQLQSRNTRLQAGSNGTSNAGSALDLLAQ